MNFKVSIFYSMTDTGENGTSNVIPGLYSHHLRYCPYGFVVFSIQYFVERTFVQLKKSHILVMLSGNASFTQARIWRPQKPTQSITQKSRFHETEAKKKTPQMTMNQTMPTVMSCQQMRIGWLKMEQKDKRNKNSTVLLLQ